MEKARLNVYDSKKGKPVVEIVFEDDKKIPVPALNIKDPRSLNGKEVEVEREKGQIVKIVCDGNEIYSRRPSGAVSYKKEKDLRYRTNQHPSRESNSHSVQYASAPYNFVPLNDRVVPAEEVPEFDKYHNDRYTGYIDIEIETLTPLYIRDSLTMEEYKEKADKEAKGQTYINPDFFSPGGLTRIPGSSLRGMIRTLVEIMSFGKFEFFDDKRLYYRSFADKCVNFRNEYRKHIKPQAGILVKKGLKYYIIPTTFTRIKTKEAEKLLKKEGMTHRPFNFYEIKYNGKSGYLVVSGFMQKKEHDYFIEKPLNAVNLIELQERDIFDYKNDKTRKAEINLIEMLKNKREVPCFYSKYMDFQGNERIAFGHTLMFRIPYQKTIGDHVSPQLRNKSIIDIAEAIFGNETSHASRVFFEDAYLKDGDNPFMPTSIPKILSTPKPTAFQHYLFQNEQNLKDFPRNLAHYNDTNPIRGYKLYWHKDGKDWTETNKENIEKHKTQYTKITPVKSGVKFHGRIRFENLSEVELGALLFALDLPEGCAHKLGMGKPLGLGSIKLKPSLYLSDRKRRYQNLFFEWETSPEPADINPFKKAFENYILNQLNSNLKDLWTHPRMKKLRIMLDFKHKPENKETEYMSLSDFRARKILPEPEKVIRS